MSKFVLNPLTGDFNVVPDSGTLVQKLNPVTGDFNLTKEAGKYKQVLCYLSGEFNLRPAVTQVIVHGVGSIQLTNAVENGLLSLKAFGGTEQRSLSSEYTQLEYITLNKSYFDTGITPTTDTDYELKFTIAQANTTQGTMGMLNNSTPTNNFYFMVSSGNKFLSALGTSAITLNDLPAVAVDTDYLVKVDGETLTVNGTAASNFNRGTLEATQTIDLGCRKNSENNGLTGKLYYFKIWKGGVLVAHYIPCKRNSDNVLGYYDIVNDTFGVLLTQYGTPAAGANAAPTPAAPMDIVCNNGVLKFSKNMANVNEQTALVGYYISAQGQVLESPYNRIYQEFIPCKPNTKYTISMSSDIYYISISEYSTAEDSGFVRRSAGSTGGNTQLTITTRSNTNYLRFGANLSSSNITIDDVLAINWQLEQGDTPTPYHEYVEGGIYIDGTTETINVHGKNLFDKSDIIIGKILNDTGAEIAQSSGYYSGHISVNASTEYTISQTGGQEVYLRILEYDATDTMVKLNKGTTDGTQTKTFTTGATTTYVIVSGGSKNNALGTIQLELGSTATEYAPYYDGGTATAEILLKIGDYTDEQEILSGNITRKVGMLVLDGTENWVKGTSFYTDISLNALQAAHSCICNYYAGKATTSYTADSNTIQVGYSVGGTIFWNRIYITANRSDYATAADFKAWLSDQYNAGTPVIIVYPLNTPTTESVAGQTMNIPSGNSTIEITQASLDNLELEATYEQEA